MAVTQKNKTPIAELNPAERVTNFKEVCLGYTAEEAKREADRCLQCKTKPCVSGCPVGIDIPGFIRALREESAEKAAEIIAEQSCFPAVCGRVCPQEKQCEGVCTVGKIKDCEPVAIGKLERFVADRALEKGVKTAAPSEKNGRKVAVIGSGPSALALAGSLAKKGFEIKIFEALHEAGGVLLYGIPEFRLPKKIVAAEIEKLKQLGVDIECNVVVGKTVTLDELRAQYDAVYIAIGAGTPHMQGIPGTSLNGVYSANEYLTRINLMKGYKFPESDTPAKRARNVVVVGAGNVAMDSARCAKRLGAESVTLVYRRSVEEMPARIEEYHHAVQEGIEFAWLTNPVAYLGDENGRLKAVRCVKMELGELDESGRRRPVPVKDSEFEIPCDLAVEAIGQGPNRILLDEAPDLALNRRGYIEVDPETGKTSLSGVYAGGDITTGAATVIGAMGAARRASAAIEEYLKNPAETKK